VGVKRSDQRPIVAGIEYGEAGSQRAIGPGMTCYEGLSLWRFACVALYHALPLPYWATSKAANRNAKKGTNDASKALILPMVPCSRLIAPFSRFTVQMSVISLVEHETGQNQQISKGFVGFCANARSEGGERLLRRDRLRHRG